MNNPNTIPSDEIFNKLSGNFFKYLLESFTNSNQKDDSASNMVLLITLAILAYAGVEAVKLIFRKNFGSRGVSTTRLVLSVIAFMILSIFSLVQYFDSAVKPIDWASESSFLATGIFYLLISLFVIYKGAIMKKNKDVNPNYRGDSSILSFLLPSWKQSTIQKLGEPLLCLALGVYFFSYNPLWGTPLIFCAISAWLHVALETAINLGRLRDSLSDTMSPRNREKKFSRVLN